CATGLCATAAPAAPGLNQLRRAASSVAAVDKFPGRDYCRLRRERASRPAPREIFIKGSGERLENESESTASAAVRKSWLSNCSRVIPENFFPTGTEQPQGRTRVDCTTVRRRSDSTEPR